MCRVYVQNDGLFCACSIKAAATRGEFATDEQVRAVWAKHGL